MTYQFNKKSFKTHQSFWFSNGKVAKNYRIAMFEYEKRVRELEREGWKLVEPQPRGIFQ
jgi:hypothetical protein